MKTIQNLLILSSFVLFTACSSKAEFPVSRVTPAADMTAKKSKDNQGNFNLEIVVENLADVGRLDPPMKNYSVWIVTNEFGVRNVGKLNVKNLKKTTFNTVTPFDFYEVFITAEKKGDLEYPAGVEIARTKI
ncbi:MAG: hypothetical protein JJU02_06820 [Cryomorphaceae bacterium]|nr:hypothetical protein [Cryomorphaceae bacterium]